MTTELATEVDLVEIESDLADSEAFWESVKEANEEILRSNPNDEVAQAHLAEYHEWKRTYLVPKKHKGKWARTDKGYRIKTAKQAKAGDTCVVKMRSGEQRVFTLSDGGDGLWLGPRIDRDWGAA
jgi:hypothetical protein